MAWEWIRSRLGQTASPAQAMVELALLLPALLLLVMGALQIALLCIVWVGLQSLVQDTARWMAVSSPVAVPTTGNCAPTGTNPNYPRPRWATGDDGTAYRNCTLPPLVLAANFTSWNWTPACATGVDCYGTGVRAANEMLTLTATYNWSNVAIVPGITGSGITAAWQIPTTVTVTAAEVMQY